MTRTHPLSTDVQTQPGQACTFLFGPFRFTSELDIAELRGTAGPGSHAVQISLGHVPEALAHAFHAGPYTEFTATEYLLNIPGTARYHARNGNHVTVELAPGAQSADITTYLLGSIFGALCYQNGLLPLHASAVESGGAVTAFLGDSGAGKSTMAACLNQQGLTIVADDICLLDPTDTETPCVIPVSGWLKLWNQSLEHLGQTPAPEHRVHSAEDKYRVYVPGTSTEPQPLRNVVFLDRAADPAAAPNLEPLAVPEAVALLIDMAYASYIPFMTGQQPRLFRECAAVFRHARAFRLTRPWSLDRTDDVLSLLDRHLFTAPGA